jgi:uncharacterized protein
MSELANVTMTPKTINLFADVGRMRLGVEYTEIERFCLKHHITKLAFFGSILRDDFDEDSDIDVLVEFATGHTPDFFVLYELEQALSRLFAGRTVDLVTYKALNPLLRPSILAQAQVVYEQG